MISETLLTNVSFALTAGVATFFSPCAYPLLPGYVGFYVNSTDTESASVTGAGIRGVAAALGVLATFALLGGATAWVGHEALSDITIFETLVGGLPSSSDYLSHSTALRHCRYHFQSADQAFSASVFLARDTH